MAADGSIIFEANIDDKKAQKELSRLQDKIQKTQEKLSKSTNEQSGIKQNLEAAKDEAIKTESAVARLREEYKSLSSITSGNVSTSPEVYIDSVARQAEVKAQLKEQEALLKEQDRTAERLGEQYTKITDKVIEQTQELDAAKNKASEYAQQIVSASKSQNVLAGASQKTAEFAGKMGKHINMLAKRVLVFSLITAALRKLKDLMGKAIAQNKEASAAVAHFKAALLTLAQPILEVLIPVFTVLLNILARVMTLIARFVSALFGKSFSQMKKNAQALNTQAGAIEAVGDAAEEASGSLADFDELTTISYNEPETSGAGGVGGIGSDDSIAPDFSLLDETNERLDRIAKAVLLIGAGFALWKIAQGLPGMLGTIATKLAGIAIAVGGLILLWDGLKDAWENGVDWGNFSEIIAGAATAAIGLYIAFGKIGAGIALVAAGIGMVVTGFHDIIENGANLQNVLLMIAGIVATGLGFFFLTSSVIPLIIAGIAAVAAAVLALTGNLEEFCQNLKENILGGLIDFIKGVFTGDWEMAWEGVKKIFKGVWNGVVMILESAVNLIIRGINWLISQLNKIHFTVPSWVPGIGGKSIGINIPAVGEIHIPRLAQGTVIPPNREFLAVLGDQKHGTNIEAPLDTIQQAAAQAFAEMGPQFARAIVSELVATGIIGNIRAIEDYSRVTAQKEFSLGKPSSTAGRWVSQSLDAYDAVRG